MTTRRQALNYLNRLARAGEFTPAKPLREYKTETLQRKAATFQAQKKAGQPINNAVARGHAATPEHPGRKPPQHPPARPQGVRGIPKDIQVGQDRIRTTESARVAEKTIREAARGGDRVVIKVMTSDGEWHTIGENTKHGKGMSADYLRDHIKEAGSLHEGIIEATQGGGGSGGDGYDDDFDWDDIVGYQIDVLGWFADDYYDLTG